MSTVVYQPGALLQNQFVFLSASKPSRNFDKFPLTDERGGRTSIEIEEAVVSLARAVFSRGGRLVFGGHPSISPLVASVAAEYFPARHILEGQEPVWIYQSRAFQKVIPPSTESLEKLGYAKIHWIDRFDDEEFDPKLAGQEQCLESLRLMRQAMIQLRPSDDKAHREPEQTPLAMVAIGGMEGVLREARLFLDMTGFPVYVLGSTGGAASRLLPYLKDNLLKDDPFIEHSLLENRVALLEELFPTPRSASPMPPYAVLMQRMVLRIAGKDPRSR